MPKFKLTLHAEITIDTDDLNPDIVHETAHLQTNIPPPTNSDNFTTKEWQEVLRCMVDDDINAVIDLEDDFAGQHVIAIEPVMEPTP